MGVFHCDCYNCGHHFDVNSQKLAKKGGAKCPLCGKWLPIREDARDRVRFVSELDARGKKPWWKFW